MYCKKCEKELEENAKFCRYCGEKIVGQSVEQSIKTKNKSLKKLWIVIAVGVIVVGIVVFSQNTKKDINLEEYVNVEFYGYDTVGAGYFWVDNSEIPEGLLNSIYLTPDYSENLSNGDELVISIYYDNDIAKDYDIEFLGEQVTVEVSGLKELVEVNPFDGFSFETYGTSPFGMAEFSYNGNNEYIKAENFYYYNVEDEMNLRNGDTVTIEYVNSLNPAECGYTVTEYLKDYTVEGLDEYVASYDDLSESFLTYAKEEAVDVINVYAAKEYSENVGMSPVEYVGYIYKVKNNSTVGEYNVMYLIYRSKISHVYGFFDEQYIYYPVKFNNIISSNGMCSADEPEVEGYVSEPIKTVGYRLPTLVYKELVTESGDAYEVTVGGGFEMYAKDSFIYGVSDIEEEKLALLESRAVSLVNEHLDEDDDFRWYTKEEITIVGEYFLVAKNQGDLKNVNNRIIVVCSVSLIDENENSSLLYLPVLYDNVEVFPDGDISYFQKEITGEYKGVEDTTGPGFTRGYIDESEMYNDLVKQYLDSYNGEVYGGLQTY